MTSASDFLFNDERDFSHALTIGGVDIGIARCKNSKPEPRLQQDMGFVSVTAGLDTKEEAKNTLLNAFQNADQATRDNKDGSCATVAVISADGYLTLAHLGDSPAVLFVRQKDGHMTAKKLTKDHCPSHEPEGIRITELAKSDNYSEAYCIDGYLNYRENKIAVTRSLGDSDFVKLVSKEPEINQWPLSDLVKNDEEAWLCVSSDGLYQRNTPEMCYANELISAAAHNQRLDSAAQRFNELAKQQKSNDDLTTVLIALSPQPKESFAVGVFDGHGETSDVAKTAAGIFMSDLTKSKLWSKNIKPPENGEMAR
jgi:serine/threonine protein phosphatase PrpC